MIAPGDMVLIDGKRAIAIAPDDGRLPEHVRRLIGGSSLALWVPVIYCGTGRVDVVLPKNVEVLGPLAQISAAARNKGAR